MKSFRLKPSRKLSVFIICLVIATFFWLLNQLTKDYHITVNVPIKYVNLPKDKVVTNYLPGKIQFQITGDGYNLLSVNEESEFDSIRVDVRSLRVFGAGKKKRAAISTRFIQDRVKDQLGNKIIVEQISQDTIAFAFEEKLEKVVPIKFNVSLEAAKQYLKKGEVEYTPKEVVISGPYSIVEGIQYMDTSFEEFSGLEEPIEQTTQLIQPHPLVDANYAQVEYKVDIENYTEKEINIPINVSNLPDSIGLNTFPSKVVVKYRVGLSMYEKYGKNSITAYVDYNDIEKDHPSRVKVRLDKKVSALEIVSIIPERVEYIIRK